MLAAAPPALASGLRLIRATGEDVRAFLQGQLTADLRRLAPNRALPAGLLSPKGRLLAVLTLIEDRDGSVLIEVRAELREALLKRLRMFILRARVQLSPLDQGALLFGSGPCLQAAGWSAPLPQAVWEQVSGADGLLIRRPGPDRLLWIAPSAAADIAADDEGWRLAEIRAGAAVIWPETQDRHVPQMAGLERLGALAFDKGCYTGQEIVARLHYLGEAKRALFRLAGDGPAPAPGSSLRTADAAAAGEVLDAVALGSGFEASAVLLISAASQPLRTEDGRPVTVRADPATPAPA
ncbi:MAG TPA: hypothetical protein VFV27_05765 [Nevskiaceae bacterium]|nr:hypothetical protein [Nevskiaceae bacterium]